MNIGEEIVSQLLEESTPIIALYPGKFKPPHAGHFDVVIKAAEIADKVIVIMSQGSKDEFTAEDSMKVWRLYEDILPSNVQVIISGKASPVSEVFDIIKDKKTDFIVLYGKGEESRYRAIEKDPNTYPNVKVVDAGTFEGLHATDLRNAINNKNLEDIQKHLPKGIDAKQVLSIYTQNEFKPGPILHESFTPQKAPLMKKFIEYACNELSISEPQINIINSPTYSQENHSFGGYIPSEEKILVVVHNRNMADILRTLAHELVHHHQKLNGDELDGEDGSETENEANAMAGVIMRKFGRENPEIFENELKEMMYPPYKANMVGKTRYKASDTFTNDPKVAIKKGYLEQNIVEADPKTGTGKKPKGSGRRLYTDEDPKDTVSIKFKTKEDIVDTLNKDSFKSKPHNRQSQIINVIHQRVRAAYSKAKDPEVKSRLKRALDYIERRKETSKKKTERLNKIKETSDLQSGKSAPYGSGFAPVKELVTDTEIICGNCGWEWKIVDGGDDLYICHKCGNDNTPEQLNEKCWPGYTKKGMKTMFGKKYPNCVKK